LGDGDVNLKLKLSSEHSGFSFEQTLNESANKIKKHSGGFGTKALRLVMESQKEKKLPNNISGHTSERCRHFQKENEVLDLIPKRQTVSLFSCFQNCWNVE